MGYREQRKGRRTIILDKRGTLFIWVTGLLAIVVLGFGWFVLAGPAYMIIDMMESTYGFSPEAQPTINLIKNVLGWTLIVLGVGLLAWALIPRKQVVTYPI